MKEYLKKLLQKIAKDTLKFKQKINENGQYVFNIDEIEIPSIVNIIKDFLKENSFQICSCNDCQNRINKILANYLANLLDNHLPNPN